MFNKNKHLDEQELQCLVDGEMGSRRRRQVEHHLDSCWQCRTDVRDRERLIVETMHARNERFQASIENSSLSTERLLQRIRYALEAESTQASALTRRERFLSRVWASLAGLAWRPIVVSTMALLCVSISVLWLRQPEVVSAHALLMGLTQQEQMREKQHDKVEFHRVDLSMRSTRISRSYYRDSSGKRTADIHSGVAVADGNQGDSRSIRHAFEEARMDWEDPLSMKPFLPRDGNQEPHAESVQNLGNGKYNLFSEYTDGLLSSAEITVQLPSYRPTEISISFRSGEILDVKEQEFYLADLDTAFPKPDKAQQVVVPKNLLSFQPLFTRQSQINAILALDRDGVFEPGDVEWRPLSDGRLEIRGVISDVARRDRILKLLRRQENAKSFVIALSVPRNDPARDLGRMQSIASSTVESTGSSVGTPELKNYLSRTVLPENIESSEDILCNQVLDQLSFMQSQVRALRELSKLSSIDKSPDLPEETRQQEQILMTYHALQYRAALSKVRKVLEPAYPHSVASNETASATPLNGQSVVDATETLARLSSSLEDDVWKAFSAGNEGSINKNSPLKNPMFWIHADEAEHLAESLKVDFEDQRYAAISSNK